MLFGQISVNTQPYILDKYHSCVYFKPKNTDFALE